MQEQGTGGGGDLVREIFCPEKFSAGKIPPQSLKVMGKIAPHFSTKEESTKKRCIAGCQGRGAGAGFGLEKDVQHNVETSSSRYWAAAAFAEQRPTENTVSVDTALTINWQQHVVGSLKCPEG